MKHRVKKTIFHPLGYALGAVILMSLFFMTVALADIPGRRVPGGGVPNPGAQEQDLANLTPPAPYNVFEFVVTCGACHGGAIDQQAAHFGNWAGTNMSSSARDPVFRANQIIVNNTIQAMTGEDGAGNMCFRCHSPNAWHSGRTNPALGGKGDGSLLMQDPLLSTDAEGILCEACHRTVGSVTMKRPGLDLTDPAWNMLRGISDWPHLGGAYPLGPLAGDPMGDATLQHNNGLTYGGKYAGTATMNFGDRPAFGTYTGQTYGVYPPGWRDAQGNDVGGQMVVDPDGSIPVSFEAPTGPPQNPDGTPNNQAQAMAPEHTTFKDDFLTSSEFCGSCHDLTIPVLEHGMPEQRTYTEWKHSQFGRDKASPQYTECQGCHMPTLKHEFTDAAPVSLNPDPAFAGWFPYAKDRNDTGGTGLPPGTSFHKLAGSNRDLPQMMKLLYPEVDLAVIGVPTGNDTRLFPGMLSSRNITWDRTTRNTELSLHNGETLQIVQAPAYKPELGKWEVKVKVTNNSGHRIPSGYPDGRRVWINLEVNDASGNLVYESGHYNYDTSWLTTDGRTDGLNYALQPLIDGDDNAVMIYEKRTGLRNADGVFTVAPNILNDTVVFDNRIPPAGYSKAEYIQAGSRFVSHDRATYVPYDDNNRYPDGVNYDVVTYRFSAPPDAQLQARSALNWQTHPRDFMEYLKENDTSTLRPEGPPSLWDINYPWTPNYLSDSLGVTLGVPFSQMTDMGGAPLRDNWGGIAYAAWLNTGRGEPFRVALDDTRHAAPPPAPVNVSATTVNTIPTDPASMLDPFTLKVAWDPVPEADGYVVWIRYGASDATASWDQLAVINDRNVTQFLNEGLNVAKTYGYRVQAFNGKGHSLFSDVVTARTPWNLPLEPINLTVVQPVQPTAVTLSWYDQADSEQGFIIERQDVPATAPFAEIARIPSPNGVATGSVSWTDNTALPGKAYNYQVSAYNGQGTSIYSNPVGATTPAG